MKISCQEGKKILGRLSERDVLICVVDSDDGPTVKILLRAAGEIKIPSDERDLMGLSKEELLKALFKSIN